MTLAERLRAVREARGLSQTELAQKADISLSNISKIEHQRRTDLKMVTAEKLATALECSAEWLLLGSGELPDGVRDPNAGAAA